MKRRTGTLFKRGDTFYLEYTVEGKRFRQCLDTNNRREAEIRRDKTMAPLAAADRAEALEVITARLSTVKNQATRLQEETNPPLTLDGAWQAYMDSRQRPRRANEGTLHHYAGHLSAFCTWVKDNHPGVVYLRDVSPDMADGFIRSLEKEGLSGNRINKYLQFLKTLFRVLAKPARLSINPFADIVRMEQSGNTKRPLTIEELKHIIESATGEMQTLLMIGTFTGLRLGDAATLLWSEVDLDRAIIRRIPNKTRRSGQAVIIGIPSILGAHLARLERAGQYVVPGMADLYQHDTSMISRRISAHLESCGIQTVMPGTGEGTGKRAVVMAGFHSLRHSFVSLHAQAGTPQAILQKLAGHGNPIMTEHYTHIDEQTARQTASAFPALLGPPTPARLPSSLHSVDAHRVKDLAGMLNGKTWRMVKLELEKLVAGSP